MKKQTVENTSNVESAVNDAQQAQQAFIASKLDSTAYLTRNAFKSRRSFIIDRLCSNMYDKHALAEEVTLFFADFQNVKRNLQAVSSICNDLRDMYSATVKVCETTSRVIVSNMKRTSRSNKRNVESIL